MLPPHLKQSRTSRTLRIGDGNIVTHGIKKQFWQDIYHYSLTARWPVFFLTIGAIFLLLNALFATLYLLGTAPIANMLPQGFLGAFFFSVETLATVGYGDMHPQTVYAHIVATVEIFVGMSSVALITGVMFARFSRPRALIMFAQYPVIGPIDGKTTLMIRTANGRQNVLAEASAKLRMIRTEITADGFRIRRLTDLKLQRDQHPIFLLGWNLIHIIDETSPLFNETADSLKTGDTGLIVTLDGIDETTSQSMQARCTYPHHAIRWQHRYVDMLFTDDNGMDHMDYTKFHDVIPYPHPPQS